MARLFPGMNPATVWDIEYRVWREFVAAHDMLVAEAASAAGRREV